MRIVCKAFCFILLMIFADFASAVDPGLRSNNHNFTRVELGYPGGDLCSFQFGPVYFCDDRHLDVIKDAIQTMKPDFNGNFIVVPILERKQYFQKSLVVIDARTGIVYPMPFDFYSGYIDGKGRVSGYGKVLYDLKGARICIVGSIVAHRQIDNGKLCWEFDGEKFVGHHTPYMD